MATSDERADEDEKRVLEALRLSGDKSMFNFIDRLAKDRDEWRRQHDNLVEVRRADLAAVAAAQQAPQARAAILEEAARACEKRAEERCHEYGSIDGTTGAWEGPPRTADLNEEDDECAAAIRALAANPQQSNESGGGESLASSRGNRSEASSLSPNPQIASEPKEIKT